MKARKKLSHNNLIGEVSTVHTYMYVEVIIVCRYVG